ncbi:MAG: TetR/AcrR family transcriptional regulator, partial [Halobacteria archaeon]|nr:TetR/AcrR family transcriptional regulator [Halobacteria archaeon]
MSDIADEFDKSQSLLHYHFETKHDLFVAFLDYLHEEIVSRTEEARAEADDPEEELMAIIELFFSTPDDFEGIQKALLELKAQASYDDDYREKMTEFDREMERVVSETVERGI